MSVLDWEKKTDHFDVYPQIAVLTRRDAVYPPSFISLPHLGFIQGINMFPEIKVAAEVTTKKPSVFSFLPVNVYHQ